jgi:hypothetical protein
MTDYTLAIRFYPPFVVCLLSFHCKVNFNHTEYSVSVQFPVEKTLLKVPTEVLTSGANPSAYSGQAVRKAERVQYGIKREAL